MTGSLSAGQPDASPAKFGEPLVADSTILLR